MTPNKIHSKHLSKCYYIFSILFPTISFKKWQFGHFPVYWEVICLKIPADVLLWFIWKETHPARNTYRKTPTSSKILLGTFFETNPKHQLFNCSLGWKCTLARTQEDSKISQQGKNMFPLSCYFYDRYFF